MSISLRVGLSAVNGVLAQVLALLALVALVENPDDHCWETTDNSDGIECTDKPQAG